MKVGPFGLNALLRRSRTPSRWKVHRYVFLLVFCAHTVLISLTASAGGSEQLAAKAIAHSIQVRNPFVFTYLLEKNPIRFSKETYKSLLSLALRPEVPPCFAHILLNTLSSDYPSFLIEQYIGKGQIQPKGLELILSHLKTAGKIPPDVNYVIHEQPTPENRTELNRILSETAAKNGRTGIFLSQKSHWTLIYVDKDSSRCRITVSDAVQNSKGRETLRNLSHDNAIPNGCKLFYPKVKKQHDGYTCAIFSICDFIGLNEMDDSSFNNDETESEQSCPIELNPVPHELMSTVQSLTTILNYIDQNRERLGTQVVADFMQNLKKNTVVIPRQLNQDWWKDQLKELSEIDIHDTTLKSKYLNLSAFPDENHFLNINIHDPLSRYGYECNLSKIQNTYYNHTKDVEINAKISQEYEKQVMIILDEVLK